MEGDRKTVSFVADLLDEQQRGAVYGKRDGLFTIAHVEQLLFLRDRRHDEIGQTQVLESGIGGRQLTTAAVHARDVRTAEDGSWKGGRSVMTGASIIAACVPAWGAPAKNAEKGSRPA